MNSRAENDHAAHEQEGNRCLSRRWRVYRADVPFGILTIVAVYHFTLHAMGSWRADHPRGYTVREEGYQLPDPDEQQRREEKMSQPVVEFDEDMQRILIAGTYDHLHAKAVDVLRGTE